MASPPVTFPCPFCTRRMGVPAELLGRQVRCPHCKQVVVAPASAGAAPAPVPPSEPRSAPEPSPAPVVAPERNEAREELLSFHTTPREGADSILSEPNESDDEVFGSDHGRAAPPLPPIEPAPPAPHPLRPAMAADNPLGFGPQSMPVGGDIVPNFLTATVFPFPKPAPEPAPTTSPTSAAKSQPLDPFADLGLSAATPANTRPAPKPVAAIPQPVPAPPAPTPVPGSNPFGDLNAPILVRGPKPISVLTSEHIPDETEDDARTNKPARPEEAPVAEEQPTPAPRSRADASGGAGKTVLIALLAGYACVATAAAIYGLFIHSSNKTDAGHPLSTIPDTFGEFDPVSRKKVSRATFPVDGELPAAQRAALGGRIAIGQLEVQPVKVEKRTLVIQMEDASGKEKKTAASRGKALVLTLDVKNTSPDLSIFPMDPAFTRREGKDDQPATRLVAGKRTFCGGEIEWPLPAALKTKTEVQQANDATPLKPGESREYVVFTAAGPDAVKAAESEPGPLLWRVQVRRGLIEYKGRDVPVTAVIGVDFKASDIREPEEIRARG